MTCIDETVRDIGWAVKQLRNGMLVARTGWNGKGMFLYLVEGSQLAVTRAPMLRLYPADKEISYREHVDIRTAQGDCVPWVCNQSDLLAQDWDLVW